MTQTQAYESSCPLGVDRVDFPSSRGLSHVFPSKCVPSEGSHPSAQHSRAWEDWPHSDVLLPCRHTHAGTWSCLWWCCCRSESKCSPEVCVTQSWSPPWYYLRRGGKLQRSLVGAPRSLGCALERAVDSYLFLFGSPSISGYEGSDFALTTTTILSHTPNPQRSISHQQKALEAWDKINLLFFVIISGIYHSNTKQMNAPTCPAESKLSDCSVRQPRVCRWPARCEPTVGSTTTSL